MSNLLDSLELKVLVPVTDTSLVRVGGATLQLLSCVLHFPFFECVLSLLFLS